MAGKGPQKELRACFSLYPESVTLVAAVDAGIADIADLRAKRANIGSPGSGERQNAIDALAAVGLDYTRDIVADSVKASAAPGLLQEGRIDAFFYTVGHPSGAIKEAIAGHRKVRLASIRGIDRSSPSIRTTPAARFPSNITRGSKQDGCGHLRR